MAGRGRGRSTMSFPHEQLGIAKDQQPAQLLQPPPKFPPLIYKPMTVNISDELSYLFQLKSDFAEFMKESPYNVEPVIVKKDIDRYSDHYASQVASYGSRYDWSRMPPELKPLTNKRKRVKDGLKPSKRKDINIEEKLKELEKMEVSQNSDVEEDAKDEEEEEKDPDEVLEDEEDDVDEEMDDGTDYVNNYFDNGEGYDEEEDNIDDGPIY